MRLTMTGIAWLVLSVAVAAAIVAGSTELREGDEVGLLPPVSGGSGAKGEQARELRSAHCAGLRGTVVNWGFQNEPGVTLRLGDGGWELVQITSTDGRYGFGRFRVHQSIRQRSQHAHDSARQ